MKKIIYWSPYLGHIGTKKSTLNSARGISFYGKNKFDVKLVNAVGEWNGTKDIKIINFFTNIYKNLPQGGFIKSRISYLIIFLLSIIPLYNLLKKENSFIRFNYFNKVFIFLYSLIKFCIFLKIKISDRKKLQ